jgi:hypothetical protein
MRCSNGHTQRRSRAVQRQCRVQWFSWGRAWQRQPGTDWAGKPRKSAQSIPSRPSSVLSVLAVLVPCSSFAAACCWLRRLRRAVTQAKQPEAGPRHRRQRQRQRQAAVGRSRRLAATCRPSACRCWLVASVRPPCACSSFVGQSSALNCKARPGQARPATRRAHPSAQERTQHTDTVRRVISLALLVPACFLRTAVQIRCSPLRLSTQWQHAGIL